MTDDLYRLRRRLEWEERQRQASKPVPRGRLNRRARHRRATNQPGGYPDRGGSIEGRA